MGGGITIFKTKLFSPLNIRNVTLKNRIAMSPMCMYSAKTDGKVTDFHLVHYASRAIGQVGLLITEATGVTPQGRISPNDLGIWEDDQVPGLKRLTDIVHKHGSKIGIQLAHAGRKAEVEGEIIAPSPLPFDENMKTPREMNKEDIRATISAFKEGARRAKEAGFDVIEIHGAHGYLISEFLSPLTNHRKDEYGGSRENRYRFLSKIITAVREVWEGPLFVRVSAYDYHPDGNTVEDFYHFGQWMKEQGVDLIDVSSGAVVPAEIDSYPGYQVLFSEKIRREVDIPTGTVGMIISPLQAEGILKNERADIILLGRELLRDPYWPRRAAKELNYDLEPPEQYKRGWNE